MNELLVRTEQLQIFIKKKKEQHLLKWFLPIKYCNLYLKQNANWQNLWNDRQRGPSKGLIYIKFNTVRSSQSDDSERIKLEKQPKYITITIKKQKQLTTLLRVIGD